MKAQTTAFGIAMDSVTRALERLSGKVEDVDKRLIRVEEAKHGRDIERLEKALAGHAAALREQMAHVTELVGRNSGRIDALEAIRNRQEGMGQMALWLHKFGPWAIAAAGAALAWAGFPPRG